MAEQTQFEKFKNTWNELITKIENEPIDGDGVTDICLHFHMNKLETMKDDEEESENDTSFETELIDSKVEVALMIAHSARAASLNFGLLD
jgi:hypothetical protein